MPSHSLKYTQDFSRKPKKGFFFSACFSYAYFFYQVILSPGNRKRSPCATIKKERGLAAPVS